MHKLKLWVQGVAATLGGGGVFLLAFFDSSVLSFPLITDGFVIEMSITHPSRMPYYAAMAALGSLAGCIWLYWLARKGGEAFFRRRAGAGATRAKRWVEKNAFLTAFLPAVLPPPCPFKIFILAEGVFQVPLRTFVLALLLGRGLRYFGEGILAVKYGDAAVQMVASHGLLAAVSVAVIFVALYLTVRLLFPRSESPE